MKSWSCAWLVAAGCVGGPQPLSELHATKLTVYGGDTLALSNVGPSINVMLETPDCAPPLDDASASFGGIALMPFEKSGHDGGCFGWTARLPDVAPGALDSVEPILTIRDASETWSIEVPGLHDGNVALSSPVTPGRTVAITWVDGPRIWAGHFHLVTSAGAFDLVSTTTGGWHLPTAAGDPAVVDVPASAGVGAARVTLDVNGERTPAPRCEGPSACALELAVGSVFDVTIGN